MVEPLLKKCLAGCFFSRCVTYIAVPSLKPTCENPIGTEQVIFLPPCLRGVKFSPAPCEDASEQVIDAFEDAFENEDEACELKRFLTHLVAPLQEFRGVNPEKVPTPSFPRKKRSHGLKLQGKLWWIFLLQSNELPIFLVWNFFTPFAYDHPLLLDFELP